MLAWSLGNSALGTLDEHNRMLKECMGSLSRYVVCSYASSRIAMDIQCTLIWANHFLSRLAGGKHNIAKRTCGYRPFNLSRTTVPVAAECWGKRWQFCYVSCAWWILGTWRPPSWLSARITQEVHLSGGTTFGVRDEYRSMRVEWQTGTLWSLAANVGYSARERE